jgi:5-oxoprolinase (ATP-hydrolysing)
VVIPEGSMLSPNPPAATVAGNVETSQCITDALYGALGVMAASYGTMNNFTFGNERYQYYETISGGRARGRGSTAPDTVQCHMTNSRLTGSGGARVALPGAHRRTLDPQGQCGGWALAWAATARRAAYASSEPMTGAILAGTGRIPGRRHGGRQARARSGATGWSAPTAPHRSLGYADETEVGAGEVFVIETPAAEGTGR